MIVLGSGTARIQPTVPTITVPTGTMAIILNGAAAEGGAGKMAGPAWVNNLSGTSADIGTKLTAGGFTEVSWTAFG